MLEPCENCLILICMDRFSEYRIMWVLVFFDLPVTKTEERKAATKFRNFLLKDGYYMVQFSVYSRVCNGNDAVEKHTKRLKASLPKNGSIRLLVITEKQYQNMVVLLGKMSKNEKSFQGEQLTLL